MPKIALQLYTVRNELDKDFTGTLKAVAKMGYAGIEGGGTGPLTAAEFKQLMADLRLNPIGAHASLKALAQDARSLALYREIGTRYVGVSENREDAEGWTKLGAELEAVGQAAAAQGIVFQYHNHAQEFRCYGGKTALEILLENCDPAAVGSQLDVGWVQRAGEDPVGWLLKLKTRVKTIHIKDTTAGDDPQWTEVGTGTVDFRSVDDTCRKLGIEWYIVEQDTCARPELESAALSLENILKITGSK